MPDPRNNPDDAYDAFMSMGDDEFRGLTFSLLRGGVLQPAEQVGYERAMVDRPARAKVVEFELSDGSITESLTEVQADIIETTIAENLKRFPLPNTIGAGSDPEIAKAMVEGHQPREHPVGCRLCPPGRQTKTMSWSGLCEAHADAES